MRLKRCFITIVCNASVSISPHNDHFIYAISNYDRTSPLIFVSTVDQRVFICHIGGYFIPLHFSIWILDWFHLRLFKKESSCQFIALKCQAQGGLSGFSETEGFPGLRCFWLSYIYCFRKLYFLLSYNCADDTMSLRCKEYSNVDETLSITSLC